jgi:MFS family permease
VYYGNTISSPVIIKLVSPYASLIGQAGWALVIFAVAALPGFILAAFTIDKVGRKLLQAVGFAVMAVTFACMWLVSAATTTLLPFLLLFGAAACLMSSAAAGPGQAAHRRSRSPGPPAATLARLPAAGRYVPFALHPCAKQATCVPGRLRPCCP